MKSLSGFACPFPPSLCVLLTCLGSHVYTQDYSASAINDAALSDTSYTEGWLAYGRTHYEQRFSPLTDIDTKTVKDLKVDWHLDLPLDTQLVSTPLVVDGILYFVGQVNVVRAVDAKSGELLWTYDPKSGEQIKGKPKTGWFHNRGLTFYKGRVFAATWDGRLIALDAKTGDLAWETRTFDLDQPLYITGAPKAFKGKVLIGNGGTENGPSRGFVTAYDTETGEEAWKFYIVPGNPADGFENDAMRMAAKTWTGKWWEHGGGGNAWHGFTYDPDFDTVYIGTGNGSPWNRKIRSPGGGDNLFLCSVVALNPDTGDYKWHYQTTPGETWDFNSNMDIVLADLRIDGKEVKALLHAPKNGFFYVINRADGKLIRAEKFAHPTWATHVDLTTGRPVENPEARYLTDPSIVSPTPHGAHSWHAMSFNPITGLVYLPTIFLQAEYSDDGYDILTWRSIPFDGGMGVDVSKYLPSPPKEYVGALQAWDPVAQEARWEIPQGTHWNAGTLTTAGNLVFQGRMNGNLHAYNATTGEELWKVDLGLGISAPPITYKLGDRQYLSILVGPGAAVTGLGSSAKYGWSYGIHTRRLITFSLAGTQDIPKQPPPFYPEPLVPKDFVVDPQLAENGEALFRNCRYCHGAIAVAGGMAPDLRASPIVLQYEILDQIVRQGDRAHRGMPSFPNMRDEQLVALQHFIRQRAIDTQATETATELRAQ